MAVRSALGADAARLMRQILTETTVLALLGGVLGVALAFVGVRVLNHTMPVRLPLMMRPELDLVVLLFSILVACGTGLFVGIVPAWRARGVDVNKDLKEGGRGSTSGGRSRTQSLLVIGEVGMTVMLLIGAGLLLRSFDNTMKVDPGFRPGGVVAAELSVSPATFDGVDGILAYLRDVRRELSALPGIESAATVNTVPFSGDGWGTQVWATDNPRPEGISMGRPRHGGWRLLFHHGYPAAWRPVLYRGRQPSGCASGDHHRRTPRRITSKVKLHGFTAVGAESCSKAIYPCLYRHGFLGAGKMCRKPVSGPLALGRLASFPLDRRHG